MSSSNDELSDDSERLSELVELLDSPDSEVEDDSDESLRNSEVEDEVLSDEDEVPDDDDVL